MAQWKIGKSMYVEVVVEQQHIKMELDNGPQSLSYHIDYTRRPTPG